jgi:pulcherriminic acid synthase
MTTTTGLPAFLSPEVADDPYRFYRRLRAESPVHWDEGLKGFLLSRHADVGAAYREPRLSTKNYETGLQPVFGRSLLQMDGSEHSRKRSLVTPYFRGRGLTKWDSVITRNISVILDRSVERASTHLASKFRHGNTVDLLTDYGYYLPVYVITDMLGLPHSDYDRFFSWYTAHVAFLSNLAREPEIDARGRAATAELWKYLEPIIAQRRRDPGDDLISALVTAEIDGESLDDIEVCTHITQLLNAGSETTGKTLASLFTHLLTRRELFETVREDRSWLLPAISETLRLTPPSQMNGRQPTEDIEINGVHIQAGSLVMLLIASANRDERRFSDAETFDPSRTDLKHGNAFTAAGEHFAFGGGRHFCLGAMLAKAELEHGATVLLDRFPDMDFADGVAPGWKGLKMRSVERLPVRI